MAAKSMLLLMGLATVTVCGWWALYWGWGLEVQSWAGLVIPPLCGFGVYFACVLATELDK